MTCTHSWKNIYEENRSNKCKHALSLEKELNANILSKLNSISLWKRKLERDFTIYAVSKLVLTRTSHLQTKQQLTNYKEFTLVWTARRTECISLRCKLIIFGILSLFSNYVHSSLLCLAFCFIQTTQALSCFKGKWFHS